MSTLNIVYSGLIGWNFEMPNALYSGHKATVITFQNNTSSKYDIMKKIILLFVTIALLYSCSKDDSEPKTYTINGFVQKGPFIAGSLITISELDESLNPTGRNYYSSTKNEFGFFELPNVEFRSKYVELIADGYYYNEAGGYGGWNTQSRLVLKSIVDLSDLGSININILTHIERDRLIFLVQNKGLEFSFAKKLSQNELLKIFNMSLSDTLNSEYFDISKSEKQNSILIAISSILQSSYDVPLLTSKLAGFIDDFASDGKIDNTELQVEIATAAEFVNVGGIRKNLTAFYSDTIFNQFQYFIEDYKLKSNFQSPFKLIFPEVTILGKNIFKMLDNSEINTDSTYCICVDYSNIQTNVWCNLKIQNISSSGEFIVTENDLTNWWTNRDVNNTYRNGDELSLSYQGKQSSIPISIIFKEHGEILLEITIGSEELPNINYYVTKYLFW